MLRSVPTGTSRFLGTTALSTTSPERHTNLTWLPFWLVSAKPAASGRRLISRKESGLSRPNFNLDGTKLWRPRGLRCLKMELQCLFRIGKSLFFAFPLAGDIELQALRDVPVAFAPYGSGERSFHNHIVSHNLLEGPYKGKTFQDNIVV